MQQERESNADEISLVSMLRNIGAKRIKVERL
jgi:hypothetical protein